MNTRKTIFILGLRRSGTTIFWESLRQDKRFVAYDEPYNPFMRWMPDGNLKGTWNEYTKLFTPDPKAFWQRFAPIYDQQELNFELTERQIQWLIYLLDKAPTAIIDLTRCHLKLEALKALIPNAYIVHLHRRASAFATSHLIPSRHGGQRISSWHSRLKSAYYRYTFWNRSNRYDFWQIESIIGNHPESHFGCLLKDAGFNSDRIMRDSAVTRLLAYWLFHYHRIEEDGNRIWGDHFHSVSFEDFARQPHKTITELYEFWGTKPPGNLNLSRVNPPKRAFQESNGRWHRAATIAGFNQSEIDALL